ncbi:GNAT family N-acetyltransferase [Brevibacterium sp. 50QC2O2]|jgi:ribosomal protein S18 acetylase RimI-like enzyme|uniref:GNAT family N-acetyltransferase n=1 Tax=Brevibacterium sp. 50QC2O2 TaxID=2968459 RepID=UPI00211CB63F|nr:GNAT family N-acetyltransferase [Brevibacterium sp. 50QC2O2]MCQ9387359.1 GNAT family N-acetyltransferase [Brevibacterium sp. 50QC2O2]
MSASPVIAAARPSDVPAIRAIVAAAYGQYVERIGLEPAPMNADYAKLVGDGHVVVARRDGEVVGMMVMELHPDHLHVANLAVDPKIQGSGVGSLLLTYAEHCARSQGRPEMRLYTNAKMTENLEYYSRRGFRETGRHSEDGFDRVYFTRELRTEV